MELYSNLQNDVLEFLEDNTDSIIETVIDHFDSVIKLRNQAVGIYKMKYNSQLQIRMRDYIRHVMQDSCSLSPEEGLMLITEPDIECVIELIIKRSMEHGS